MGWDSNPRKAFTFAGFQDRSIQPLWHPSKRRTLLELLRTLALRALQVFSKVFNMAVIFYIFYILYILYEKVDTNLDTRFNDIIITGEKN